jgi:hypothetical protein
MIIHTLEKDIDPFRPKQEGEEVLKVEYPYLSDISALMYLANNTRLDMAFAVNGLKDIVQHLQCIIGTTLRISYDI